MKYQAFISYSHALDGHLAPAVHTALRLLGKPWFRLEALQIFRDETDLTTSPHLWTDIKSRLLDSEYLVLLLSPTAARSKWVNREITCFLEHNPLDRMILVLTDGALVWDDRLRALEIKASTALPPSLNDAFSEEPLYVDLRAFREVSDLTLENSDFARAVMPIAATLHGRTVDNLIGSIHQQHRRRLRIRNAIISLLSLTTLIAVTLGVLARHHQLLAESRQYASEAAQTLPTDPNRGLQLALLAASRRDTPESESALRSALRAPRLIGTLDPGRAVVLAGLDLSEDLLLTVTQGDLSVHSLLDGSRTQNIAFSDRVALSASLSPSAEKVVIGFSNDSLAVYRTMPLQLESTVSSGGSVTTLICSYGGTIFWGLETGAVQMNYSTSGPVTIRRKGPETVTAMAASRSGRYLAWATGNLEIHVFDVQRMRVIHTLSGHESDIRGLAFDAADRRLLSTSHDQTARVWNLDDGEGLVLRGHRDEVWTGVFSDDNTVVTGSDDGTVRVWDPLTGHPRHVLDAHSGWVRLVDVERSGSRLVASGQDGSVRMWDIQTERVLGTVSIGSGPAHGQFGIGCQGLLTWSPTSVKVWSDAMGFEVAQLGHDRDNLTACAFSPDGQWLATGDAGGGVCVWSTADWRLALELPRHDDAVLSVAFDASSARILTASEDASARVWSVETGLILTELNGHSDGISTAAFLNDGEEVVTGSYDGTARVWTVETAAEKSVMAGHHGWIRAAIPIDANMLATASEDGTVRLWDPESGDCRGELRGHAGPVRGISLDRKRHRLASYGADGTVRFWDWESGQSLAVIEAHVGPVTGCVYDSAYSQLVTLGADGLAKLWDPAGFESRGTLAASAKALSRAAFVRTGSTLIVAGMDGHLYRIALRGHDTRSNPTVQAGGITGIAVAPDARTVAAIGMSTSCQVSHTWPKDLRALAEASASIPWTVGPGEVAKRGSP